MLCTDVALIEFRNVTKTYPGGVVALEDVSLSVEAGEFVFLVGPTGAGKSTLLRLVYRAERPTRGEVYVEGVAVHALRTGAVCFLRRRLGVVFQDFKLLPDRTAAENVAFGLRVTGTPPEEIRPRVSWALEMVGLLDRQDALPRELSGGEQQRVAIALSLIHI